MEDAQKVTVIANNKNQESNTSFQLKDIKPKKKINMPCKRYKNASSPTKIVENKIKTPNANKDTSLIKKRAPTIKSIAQKSSTSLKRISQMKWPRVTKNPFRPYSSYGKAVDILAAHPEGLHKEEFLKLYAKEVEKDMKHSTYDLAVILSTCKSASPTGPRHKSCREGFYVVRQNDHLQIRFE